MNFFYFSGFDDGQRPSTVAQNDKFIYIFFFVVNFLNLFFFTATTFNLLN